MAWKRLIQSDFSLDDGSRVMITDLHQSFTCGKSLSETTNKAHLDIYNVSKETRRKLEQAKTSVCIKAGYEDEGGAVPWFYGDIQVIKIGNDGVDRVLSIDAFDGGLSYQLRNVALSFGEGTLLVNAVNQIAGEMGLAIANLDKIPQRVLNNGFAYIGKARKALSQLLGIAGLLFTVQNGEILLYIEGDAVEYRTIILNRASGLIGSPEPRIEDEGSLKIAGKKKLLVKALPVKVFTPGSKVQLESTDYTGVYTVEAVRGSFSNMDGDFVVELDLIE